MNYDKIAPRLQCALGNYQEKGESALAGQPDISVVVHPTGARPPRVPVFLHCRHGETPGSYAEGGVRINNRAGDTCTAFVTMDSIPALSDDPAIEAITPGWQTRPLMDIATKHIKVPQFRTRGGLSGRGVIIGIVDTGIDVRHPAFEGRILSVWDQTIDGPGVRQAPFGAEFKGESMRISKDEDGHGTHVAGIAAGADPAFPGVAPEADLVIVKTSFDTVDIADAVAYVFRIADEMNRPAVVNLSLGSQQDPHDGSDGLSAAINSLSRPGRIVCCAAGNEGNDAVHAQVKVSGSGTQTIRFTVDRPSNPRVRTAHITGWYAGSQRMEVGIRLPNGQFTGFQPVTEGGNSAKTFRFGKAEVEIATPGPNPLNRDMNFTIMVHPIADLPAGTWQLLIRRQGKSQGVVDVWGTRVTFTSNVKDNMTIGSPAAATRAITVASFTTRTQWQIPTGQGVGVPFELNDISDFSSEGPLRNDAQKPDVAAPGAMIISALSRDAKDVDPLSKVFQHPEFMALNGTSMATPVVAGLIALMLEREPALTPEEVAKQLKAAASIPGKSQNTFDAKWGFGLVDASKIGTVLSARA